MATVTAPSLQQLADAFDHFRHLAGFGAIKSEVEYEQALALTEAILDAARDTPQRDDPDHPLMALLDWLTPAIRDYEIVHFPLPATTPREVLRFLMEQHGLSQSQLPEIGNQSAVSHILSGQRTLNTRQIAALTRRFGISADALIEPLPRAA